MPTLTIASPRQLYATSGRQPRLGLSDAVRAQLPQLYADQQFAQQQAGLNLAEAAQESQQRQQTIGTAIQGVGTVATAGLAAKQLGLFGSSAAPAATTAGAAAPAAVTTFEGAAPIVAGGELAGGTGTAATTAGASTLGTIGAGAGAAGAGAVGGGLVGQQFGKLAGGGTKGGLAGAAGGSMTGAGLGALVGTAIFPGLGTAAGAVIGGLAGALTGGLGGAGICCLHEAGYGKESREVQIARQFRDTFLTKAQLRAYYQGYESVAQRMHIDPLYRNHIRTALTDKLVRYGAVKLRIPYTPMHPGDVETAEAFLHHLHILGEGIGPFRRRNGQII